MVSLLSVARDSKQNPAVLFGRRLFPLLLAAFCLSPAGCDRSREQIIGKWQAPKPSRMIWEFQPDGVVHAGNVKGRYSFGDQSRLKIQTPSATFVYRFEFRDDAMIWTEPNGVRTELRRLP